MKFTKVQHVCIYVHFKMGYLGCQCVWSVELGVWRSHLRCKAILGHIYCKTTTQTHIHDTHANLAMTWCLYGNQYYIGNLTFLTWNMTFLSEKPQHSQVGTHVPLLKCFFPTWEHHSPCLGITMSQVGMHQKLNMNITFP